MKKISDSAIFKQTISSNQIVSNIKKINSQRDKINEAALEEPLNVIKKRMKFPSKGRVFYHLDRGNIVPIYNPEIKLPKYLNVLTKVEGSKLITIVDLNNFSNLNTATNELIIYPKTLFNLLQNGVVSLELIHNWNSFTNNMKIIKNGCIVYSKLMSKIMDKLYAINIDEFKTDFINFVFAKFFLINMCDKMNNETIDNIAQNACFNKTALRYLKEEESSLPKDVYTDIFKLFECLKNIKGLSTLTIRSFIENWVRMYGESSLLAVDYLPAFLSLIFGSMISGNVAKDYIIENVSGNGKFVDKIYTEFNRLIK